MNISEMTQFIHADSLAFVSIDGLYRAVGEQQRSAACPQHCDACFTGEYPTSLTDLLGRDREKRLTFVADGPGKGVQEAKFVATNLTDAVFEGNHILYTLVSESLLQGCKGCRADWR